MSWGLYPEKWRWTRCSKWVRGPIPCVSRVTDCKVQTNCDQRKGLNWTSSRYDRSAWLSYVHVRCCSRVVVGGCRWLGVPSSSQTVNAWDKAWEVKRESHPPPSSIQWSQRDIRRCNDRHLVRVSCNLINTNPLFASRLQLIWSLRTNDSLWWLMIRSFVEHSCKFEYYFLDLGR